MSIQSALTGFEGVFDDALATMGLSSGSFYDSVGGAF